jgi:rare lipoprotein A
MPDRNLSLTLAAANGSLPALIAVLLLATACAGPRASLPPPMATVPPGYEETGEASWYGPPYHGRRTASGEVYDMHQMTAAHPTLPLGTWVAVENRANGRIVEVRINDRGPFVRGRILDLSYAAARLLGAVGPGVIPVRLRAVGAPPAPLAASPGVAFAVQAGSFASEDRAQVLKGELDRTWPGASIQRAEVGGRTFYRVRLGRFPTRQEAEGLAQRLAATGLTVLVVED